MITRIYKIGTQYRTRDKRKDLCTITDIFRTYNNKGELVKTAYVSTHEFMGQTITCYDVPATAIARGLVFGF